MCPALDNPPIDRVLSNSDCGLVFIDHNRDRHVGRTKPAEHPRSPAKGVQRNAATFVRCNALFSVMVVVGNLPPYEPEPQKPDQGETLPLFWLLDLTTGGPP